ncbi:MAG: hypothetical protein PQJ50_00050 [Spirochaetales bacterium]|nr:hypothetical protein [Spirochaetales bacterium]
MKKILITGAAGFVGFHLSGHPWFENGCELVLTDNLNDYYDPSLKNARLPERGFDIDES